MCNGMKTIITWVYVCEYLLTFPNFFCPSSIHPSTLVCCCRATIPCWDSIPLINRQLQAMLIAALKWDTIFASDFLKISTVFRTLIIIIIILRVFWYIRYSLPLTIFIANEELEFWYNTRGILSSSSIDVHKYYKMVFAPYVLPVASSSTSSFIFFCFFGAWRRYAKLITRTEAEFELFIFALHLLLQFYAFKCLRSA